MGLNEPTRTFQIRVCAINANGSGPFSEWVLAATQPHERDETRVPAQPPPLTSQCTAEIDIHFTLRETPLTLRHLNY